MAKPDVKICPNCDSEIYYVAREDFIDCIICETKIAVTPTQIIEEENNEQVSEPERPTEIELLQQENAELWYTTMTNESKIESNENEIANLWYEVMMK